MVPMTHRKLLRLLIVLLVACLGTPRSASAQTLLAQTGGTKTAVGWLIVLLCIGLGLLVIGRPSFRKVTNFKLWKK